MANESNIIVDLSENEYKYSQEKHNKYYNFYSNRKESDTEYWGLGIENESYLMFDKLVSVNKDFIINNQKRERYSVNYWDNFKKETMNNELKNIANEIQIPVYLNGYLFQKTDYYGEHTKRYTKKGEVNPKFIGKTIDDYIREKTPVINSLFNNNMIYDGDTIEFITYDFYKTKVKNVVDELKFIKDKFLKEINKLLVDNKPTDVSNNYIFNDKIIYPPFNYGFAKFLTNKNNIAICNNGTYHINITLPTQLNKKGEIENQEIFRDVHSNAIKLIQWIEPFLIGLYGTPDIMHTLNETYAGGSLRLMLSRYIGLGTYDSNKMIKGKMLNNFDYSNNNHWYTKLHENSPYSPPEKIGYDINYNKFTKHGIEIRIFDYFPENYLEDIINFIILVCQHSYYTEIESPLENELWKDFTIQCIKKGSEAKVNYLLYCKLKYIFDINYINCWDFFFESKKDRTLISVLNEIKNNLYDNYKDFSICKKMSPDMKKINFIDYNKEIKEEYKKLLKITSKN
jgi:hypothetical protein